MYLVFRKSLAYGLFDGNKLISIKQSAAEGGFAVLSDELLGGGALGGRGRALEGDGIGLGDRIGSVEAGGEGFGHVEGEAVAQQGQVPAYSTNISALLLSKARQGASLGLKLRTFHEGVDEGS